MMSYVDFLKYCIIFHIGFIPRPPVPTGNFLLQDGTDFLLQDETNFLLSED